MNFTKKQSIRIKDEADFLHTVLTSIAKRSAVIPEKPARFFFWLVFLFFPIIMPGNFSCLIKKPLITPFDVFLHIFAPSGPADTQMVYQLLQR